MPIKKHKRCKLAGGYAVKVNADAGKKGKAKKKGSRKKIS
jgi:hypothetical protein